MSRTIVAIAGLVANLLCGSIVPAVWAETDPTMVRDFRSDKVGSQPAGFTFARTGVGHTGRWVVVSVDGALGGGNVLAQTDADGTDYRFPIAILEQPSLKDARISVRCAAIDGKVDRACGVIFRYQDENDYYVARANALEDNIRLYRVKNGRREQFGTWDGKVTAGTWHELKADVRGDHFVIYWDGRKVIDARDGSFPGAGKIGVWTKADSLTYFKDLKLESPGP